MELHLKFEGQLKGNNINYILYSLLSKNISKYHHKDSPFTMTIDTPIGNGGLLQGTRQNPIVLAIKSTDPNLIHEAHIETHTLKEPPFSNKNNPSLIYLGNEIVFNPEKLQGNTAVMYVSAKKDKNPQLYIKGRLDEVGSFDFDVLDTKKVFLKKSHPPIQLIKCRIKTTPQTTIKDKMKLLYGGIGGRRKWGWGTPQTFV